VSNDFFQTFMISEFLQMIIFVVCHRFEYWNQYTK